MEKWLDMKEYDCMTVCLYTNYIIYNIILYTY